MNMKLSKLMVGMVALGAVALTSCDDDDFTASIFDTDPSIDYLDKTSYTFPLDTFVKKEFLEPYNLRFVYRMEDIGSDLQKNLVPADYEKSCKLAVLSKYLWFDVYRDQGGHDFLAECSPRIIHVIGSPSYNPSSGTETLGTAEGGLKVTLYNANALDENNISELNRLFFHVMHHEFGHILDQTHLRPNAFNVISNGRYDPQNWGTTYDSISASHGFVTPYASSQAADDWVETLSSYVCDDSLQWDRLMKAAAYDWEEVKVSSYATTRDSINTLLARGAIRDSIGYLRTLANGDAVVDRKAIARNADGTAALDDNGQLVFLSQDNIDGVSVINQKVEMVRTWLKTYFNIDLDSLRREIQTRSYVTDSNGWFVRGADGNLINALTYPAAEDPSKTRMQVLMEQIEQYKQLQK